jgi:hypothetical protein
MDVGAIFDKDLAVLHFRFILLLLFLIPCSFRETDGSGSGSIQHVGVACLIVSVPFDVV